MPTQYTVTSLKVEMKPIDTYVDTSFMNHNAVPLAYLRLLESLSRDTISNPLTHPTFFSSGGAQHSVKGIATGQFYSVSCGGGVFDWTVLQVAKVVWVSLQSQSMPPTLIGMSCSLSQVSFATSNVARGVLAVLVDRLSRGSPPDVGPSASPSAVSLVFEIASLAVETAAQDARTDTALRVIQATCGNCQHP